MKELKNLNLKTKKYIIFDNDGTLVDTVGMWNMIDQKLISFFGYTKYINETKLQIDREKFLEENNSGDIYLEYGGFLIEKYNLNTNKEILLETRWKIANNFLENVVDYKEGAVELINLLKSGGYKLILATAGTREQINIYSTKNKKMMDKLNLYEYFDLILTKEDVEKKKPDPEIYLKVLELLNATNNECLVFEDSLHGVLAAKSANIEVINVYDKYSNKDRKELNRLSDYKLDNYFELINHLDITNNNVKKRILKS